MNHSKDFFRDEIRNGFYVPTAVKQAWAATLDVLSEIDRICVKYDITYYADWGSILGAVRHGGFIPWDDDLDICMKRADYVKFREVADKELPPHYDIHDFERHENHWMFLSRVVNNKKICFDPEYLNAHYNLPWLAGVDIFIKDNLYTDPDEEEKRDREILDILACADAFTEGRISKQAFMKRALQLAAKYKTSLPQNLSDRDYAVFLYKLAERVMARVEDKDSDSIGQIFPWILKNGAKSGELSKHYEKVVRLPFEDTTIPVPAYYNLVLTRRYGNYNRIRKVWGGHDYPFYEGQKKEIMKLSGDEFPGFKFSPEMLVRPETDRTGSLKTISAECVNGLEGFYNEAVSCISGGDTEGLNEVFQNSQQLAADLGTLIESVLGETRERTKAVVKTLEVYCEAVYTAYTSASESGVLDMSGIRSALDGIGESIETNILNRKEICFMTTGPKEWKAFESEYKKACAFDDTDVYVVALPLMTKDAYGSLVMSDEEIASSGDLSPYKGFICEEYLTDYASYDPALHCPDKIYIQNQYDGENPIYTVPPVFYAENLRRYTDELCFIFIGRTSEFGEEDITDVYNLKNYVTAPGIIYSDTVFVQSENIKEQYVRSLCEFAGEGTRPVWQDKLKVCASGTSDSASEKNNKKRVLFCIGANEISEKADVLPAGLKEKLEILTESSADIEPAVSIYPEDRAQWMNIDKTLSEEIFSIIDETVKKRNLETLSLDEHLTDDIVKEFDAYYGSPSPYIPAFTTQGKPVMIANFSVMGE